LSFSVRWFLWVRCVQSVHGKAPTSPSTVSKKPRPALCPSSPRRNHHQCHHRLRRAVREYIRHASLAGDVLAVGSVSQLDTVPRSPSRARRPRPGREFALWCRCPCAASPACLVLLRAPETVPRVHLKASGTAVRDAPANAGTLIPRQFRICSSCTASRLEGD